LKEIFMTTSSQVIGRVASPPQLESTSEQFYFWVQRDKVVEKTQIVRVESEINGQPYQYYGVIEEVNRRSRKKNIEEEFDFADGDVAYEGELKPEGVTYAGVRILRTNPAVLTPPIEYSKVYLGEKADAEFAYGFSEMSRALAVGQLYNGADNFAGLAQIDLYYLLGENGGHMNVSGMAGAGTKSSFLLAMLKLLSDHATKPKMKEPLFIVPIILNVKGEDLMWINHPNRNFNAGKHKIDWDALGIKPEPFPGAEFFAPADPKTPSAPAIDGCNATPYSWALSDILEKDLFLYLFADDDFTANMQALVYDLIAYLTESVDGKVKLKNDVPQNWQELLEWMRLQAGTKEDTRVVSMHQTGTWRAVYRRLWDILVEGEGIFLRNEKQGQPLMIIRSKSSAPIVVDIHSLSTSLQRFVVASIMKQITEARMGRHAVRGLRYVIMLDELNRFAPKNNSDPITKLLERVASELRSQGVILFGAQQLASDVSPKVIENSSIRVLGRTGSAELQDKVWQSWDKASKQQATGLGPNEKLIIQPGFRQPMYVRIPFPAWAMRREDIASKPLNETPEV
jgi:DNA helicase HerA-like ATPase